MERREISNFTKIILLVEFLFVAYMLYILTSSIYKSYQIDRNIALFESENKRIAEENKKLSADFEYYTSEAYQEKIAKQNFGLMNPGEEIIVLPQEDIVTFSDEDKSVNQNIKRWNIYSNPQKWWRFFFESRRF